MMKVKLIERKNPQNMAESKFYGAPVNEGLVGLDDIAQEISERSTVTYGDILGVLQNFIEFVPFVMMLGKSVSLGRLGTMRISFSSEGVNDPADFNAGLIRSKKIIFRANSQLKDKISKLKLETVK